jgi:hypothetical protein
MLDGRSSKKGIDLGVRGGPGRVTRPVLPIVVKSLISTTCSLTYLVVASIWRLPLQWISLTAIPLSPACRLTIPILIRPTPTQESVNIRARPLFDSSIPPLEQPPPPLSGIMVSNTTPSMISTPPTFPIRGLGRSNRVIFRSGQVWGFV